MRTKQANETGFDSTVSPAVRDTGRVGNTASDSERIRRPDTPTLESLISDPGLVDRVAPDAIAPLLVESAARCTSLAAIQVALAVRLQADGNQRTAALQGPARLLTADEAASKLGTSRHWIYRHAGDLPFTVRLSPRAIRFDEAGLGRYVARNRN